MNPAAGRSRRHVILSLLLGVALPLSAAACASPGVPATGATPSAASARQPSAATPEGSAAPAPTAPVSKVMIIAEENKTYAEVLGSGKAPYLERLAAMYGSATGMEAGYPPGCPSLAAYVILTSGTDHGICDDAGPEAHPLAGESVFGQVARSGRQWRNYAESMPGNCSLQDAGRYLVRHAPAAYYLDARERCPAWDVPLGTVEAGALHDDVGSGALPAYSFVSPDACNDMHGAPSCPRRRVSTGDAWLARWMPVILAGPDFRSGRLAVVLTWDEGSESSNSIATLVLSARTSRVSVDTRFTHCSTLRTVEEILSLPLLGCAHEAPSMRGAFGL